MKNRLLSDERIDDFINRLSETVFDAKIEKDNLISWELFFDELFMNDETIDMYNTGAIALGVSALSNSSKKNTRYKETIEKATNLLKQLRNSDGSWSVTADTSDNENKGIVYNSVIAIQSLISAGYLDLNETDPDQLTDNLDFIYESINWIYSQRIVRNESDVQYYGWGYSGDKDNKIYIMPTVNVLLTLKIVYYELARVWKRQINKIVTDNKNLLEIINEIQESVYFFRISPDEGWGKEINENKDRIVYTLYGLYGLSYSEDEEDGVEYPLEKLSDADINLFTKMMCRWNKNKYFDQSYLDSLNPEEFYDSYIQRGSSANEIIDHESFFEAIATTSIIGFVKKYKNRIKKSRQNQLYQIIVKLCASLKHRISVVNINGESYTVVRSRRGLLSQSYPIYAITQSTNALLTLKREKKVIKELLSYKSNLYKVIGFILQVVVLFCVNRVAIPSAGIPILIVVSFIAPLSEYLKNWIFSLSEFED